MLRAAGMDEDGMHRWHSEFERRARTATRNSSSRSVSRPTTWQRSALPLANFQQPSGLVAETRPEGPVEISPSKPFATASNFKVLLWIARNESFPGSEQTRFFLHFGVTLVVELFA